MEMLDFKNPVTGNLAKVKVLHELFHLISKKTVPIKILDIGCGTTLDFWEPLLENMESFELYGIDIAGIDKAIQVVNNKGWKNVRLIQLSAYFLKDLFEKGFFDIITATQVLEHIARLDKFLTQVDWIIKPGGYVIFSFDSAHHSGKYSVHHPIKATKKIVKKLLASMGNEKHYDISLYDYEAEKFFAKYNLRVLDKGFYNIHPLKEIHNKKITDDRKNEVLKKWFSLEESINMDKEFISQNKHYFLGLYYKLQKS